MRIRKHICIRHDGLVTIVPDAISIHAGIWQDDNGHEHNWVYIVRANNTIQTFWRVDEISSPYKQEQRNEVQA